MTSRAWYLVAVAILAAGIVGAVWTMVAGLSGIGETMVRVVVPGSSTLALDAAGTYTVFHETESVIDGRIYSSQSINGLQVSVTEGASGAAIPVTTASGSASYSYGGHKGVSVLAFTIARPGNYRLAAAYGDGRTEPKTVLAVDRGFVGRLVGTILGTVAFGLIGLFTAMAIFLITFFRRRRAQQLAQAGGVRTS